MGLKFFGWKTERSEQNEGLIYRSLKGKREAVLVSLTQAGIQRMDTSEPLIYFSNKQLIVEPTAFTILPIEQITYLVNTYLRYLDMCEKWSDIA